MCYGALKSNIDRGLNLINNNNNNNKNCDM